MIGLFSMKNISEKINSYISYWKDRGYPDDIPDEVPNQLMIRNLAPSYKAIALAILNNDLYLSSLGFSRPHSKFYNIIKSEELKNRIK